MPGHKRLEQLEQIVKLLGLKEQWKSSPTWAQFLGFPAPATPSPLEGYVALAKWNRAMKVASEDIQAVLIDPISFTADQARADGMVGKATELENKAQTMAQKAAEMKSNVAEKEATIAATIRGQDVQAATSAATSAKPTDLDKQTKIRYAAALEAGEPANAATMSKAAQQAASDLGRYPGEQRAADVGDKARVAANVKATEAVDDKLLMDKEYRKLQKTDAPAAEQYRTNMIKREAVSLMGGAGAPAPAAAGVPPVRGGVPTQPTIKAGQTMNGYKFKGGDPADKTNWVKV
jgi:hypothetical protein